MKLLLDQGLPRTAISYLQHSPIEVSHAADLGLAEAEDARILEFAVRENYTIVTLDADFHTLLAQSSAVMPSVIRIRIEGLKARALADLLKTVLRVCETDLNAGALVSVTSDSIRIRRLPVR
jgi:predicted nuclease of predicted toxin-antitoxin system